MHVIPVEYIEDVLLYPKVSSIMRLIRKGLIIQNFGIRCPNCFDWSTKLKPMKSLTGLPQEQSYSLARVHV